MEAEDQGEDVGERGAFPGAAGGDKEHGVGDETEATRQRSRTEVLMGRKGASIVGRDRRVPPWCERDFAFEAGFGDPALPPNKRPVREDRP